MKIAPLNINPWIWVGIAILFSFFSFLVNLGIHPFLEDEAIRATVALEMKYSGEYLATTLGGVPYFSKPPLYNWILLGVYNLSNEISEWSTRLPTVLFLYCFGIYIYFIHIRTGHKKLFAVTVALMFLTCGRILFWDSFLGLIDICFSFIMYMMMTEMYYNAKKKRWIFFFCISYLLMTIGYFLKGFPSLLVFGITMLLCVWMEKSWKKLLSLPHVISFLCASGLIFTFYYLLSFRAEVSQSVGGLLEQSTTRTFRDTDWLDVIKHIITYPFENIYHFLPWTLLSLFFLKKNVLETLRKDPFVYFCLLCFLCNISVYWISPRVYPRYILMLVPLFFTAVLYLYKKGENENDLFFKIVDKVLLGITLILPFVLLFSFITNEKVEFIYLWKVQAAFILVTIFALSLFYLLEKKNRLLKMIVILFVLRLGFNLFVLPIRTIEDKATIAKEQAQRVATEYKDKAVRIYKKSRIDRTSIFYLENELGYIVYPDSTAEIMIFNPITISEYPAGYEKIDSLFIRRNEQVLDIIKRNGDN